MKTVLTRQFTNLISNNNNSFIERSNLNYENARRLSTLMDFSVIFDKKEDLNENEISQNKKINIQSNEGYNVLNISLLKKKDK